MPQEEPVNICPACLHENQKSAEICAKCGRPIASVTTIVVPEELATPVRVPKPRAQKLHVRSTSLYIAGERQEPIVIKNEKGNERIILGRQVPGESVSTIDLTNYLAGSMGVSRRHAAIEFSNTGHTIIDLGSTNGTWLNETKLAPDVPYRLNNGDMVRLGQLVLMVYFTTTDSVENIIYLIDETKAPYQRITPYDLSTHIATYLNALAEVQYVINDLLQIPPFRVGLRMIDMHSRDTRIKVTLVGAVDAVEFVQDKIVPWRQDHEELIAQMRRAEPDAAEAMRAELLDDQKQLASALIDAIAPGLPEEARPSQVQRLLPNFRTLMLGANTMYAGLLDKGFARKRNG